jgi:uncharacterized membrane protein YidH (DUF202 family)
MTGSGADNVAAQLERTMLAWNRTSLTMTANGALLARDGFTRSLVAVWAAGFVVVAVGVAVWILSAGRFDSAVDGNAAPPIAVRRGIVRAAALFVVALSTANLALALTS